MSDLESRLVSELCDLLMLRPQEWELDTFLGRRTYKHPRATLVIHRILGPMCSAVFVSVGGFDIEDRRNRKRLLKAAHTWDRWHHNNGLLATLDAVQGVRP